MPTRGERLRFLAGLLAAPNEGALAILGELTGGFPWLADAQRELAAIALDEWQAEHGRLFINGHPHTPCLPFQSAQLDRMMPGPSTAAVATFYRDLGLAADDVAPDYLGAMLECAAYLAETPQAQEKERAIWSEHLLRWLPRYAETLQSESRLQLYRGLGGELTALCRETGHV